MKSSQWLKRRISIKIFESVTRSVTSFCITWFRNSRILNLSYLYCKWNDVFFGVILLMGNHQLPNRRIYLGNVTYLLAISTTMTQNRFDEIISILHFNDKTIIFPVTFPNSNKLHKIQTIVDHFRSKFKKTSVWNVSSR